MSGTTRRYADSPRVTTWANGFGVWHVRVDRAVTSPLIVARGALRDELTARESPSVPTRRSIYMHPIEVPELSNETTIVYKEGN
jgi:hypothetical protein